MLIGSGHFYCMDQPTFLIYSNIGFVSEMPGASFLGGVRFGVAFLLWVFRGGRCFNEGRIYNRTLFQNQTTLSEERNNLRKEFFLKVILDQQFPKPSKGISIRDLIAGFYSTEIRKGAAGYYLRPDKLICLSISLLYLF